MATKALARRRGFRYLHAAEVAKMPLEELLERVEASVDKSGRPIKTEAAALLGCPSSEFFGVLRLYRNGGSGSVSVQV